MRRPAQGVLNTELKGVRVVGFLKNIVHKREGEGVGVRVSSVSEFKGGFEAADV